VDPVGVRLLTDQITTIEAIWFGWMSRRSVRHRAPAGQSGSLVLYPGVVDRRPIAMLTLAALACLTVAACGDDGDATATGDQASTVAATSPPATTRATTPPTTPAGAGTTVPAPTSPLTQATTAPTAPPTTDSSSPIVFRVDAGVGDPPVLQVPLGRSVELTIVSPDAQELHLHGYELSDSGTEVVFAFTADLPGEFELESHDTEALIATLVVA
jgi:hypothetical protein